MTGSNDDILRVLGRVEEGIHRLRADFQEEKQSARESRSEIHKRLDRQAEDIVITGQIVAQQRDLTDELKKTVEDEVLPTVNEVKQVKAMGKLAATVFFGLGLTAGGFAIWMSDTFVPILRKWLRIE
ncbi:DUF1515 domain-containing protein [Agrobacterium genomosp. 3]|uniref:DUF1515 domain-containing protein n=1 Tax=Agrobacterium tomkonis TaxID=1183410 RepID=UPI001CD889A6|nr:DUF1515 domain-containing protein [Agrobacterium tomkonis]MCA1879323.1 DUF1515 domain-containing protein [Agrobacterium tumefaciens]MCA1894486.1 DUF1515 domain-containing protein [Agrobacterium tomkonis]